MEKREELYRKQKELLDLFLEKHAITEAQYGKSLGDLTEKMGMEKVYEEMTQCNADFARRTEYERE